MATSRHLVDARVADDYAAALAENANRLPVGDPTRGDVAIGPNLEAFTETQWVTLRRDLPAYPF